MSKPQASLVSRLWQYQKERSPIIALTIMAAVTGGLMARFSSVPAWRSLAAVAIALLYLIQIRANDEIKDFEHDNRYYPHRPVQRGLVTLDELAAISRFCVIGQLLLYLSFLDLRILGFGLLSLGYGYLCRKEFFVRQWIRPHFFIYTFAHYLQLIFLFAAMVAIIQPADWGRVLVFILLNIAVLELGRKNKPSDQDSAGDTYSSHLGYPGTAAAVIVATIINFGYAAYWFAHAAGHMWWLVLPALAGVWVFWCAVQFGRQPSPKHQEQLEYAVVFNFIAVSLAAFVGIR
jgi:4-hydroxybenzoate polyprenyltransferase